MEKKKAELVCGGSVSWNCLVLRYIDYLIGGAAEATRQDLIDLSLQ